MAVELDTAALNYCFYLRGSMAALSATVLPLAHAAPEPRVSLRALLESVFNSHGEKTPLYFNSSNNGSHNRHRGIGEAERMLPSASAAWWDSEGNALAFDSAAAAAESFRGRY